MLRAISDQDRSHIGEAIALAQRGYGVTFPNPAVGCVIVGPSSTSDEEEEEEEEEEEKEVGGARDCISSSASSGASAKCGAGWHPRAGFPHAEIYALADYTGRLPEALRLSSSDEQQQRQRPRQQMSAADDKLLAEYLAQGPKLFEDCAAGATAYVTLEPCSHVGKRTPPCAQTFVAAGVKRVVVAQVDPNPSVDGGGIDIMRAGGVEVEVLRRQDAPKEFAASESLIADFSERMRQKPDDDEAHVLAATGAGRAALRKIANQRQSSKALAQLKLGAATVKISGHGLSAASKGGDEEEDEEERRGGEDEGSLEGLEVSLDPAWMSEADRMLRADELLLLRMAKNEAVGGKKRVARAVGAAVAAQLGGHVAQVKGHTVLLYRPSLSAAEIDLAAILKRSATA